MPFKCDKFLSFIISKLIPKRNHAVMDRHDWRGNLSFVWLRQLSRLPSLSRQYVGPGGFKWESSFFSLSAVKSQSKILLSTNSTRNKSAWETRHPSSSRLLLVVVVVVLPLLHSSPSFPLLTLPPRPMAPRIQELPAPALSRK